MRRDSNEHEDELMDLIILDNNRHNKTYLWESVSDIISHHSTYNIASFPKYVSKV